MTPTEVFAWGLLGSISVEIAAINKFMVSDHKLPDRYRKTGFWIARSLLAVVGGGLAVAYGIDKALLAANIGAATPLIVNTLSQGIPPGAPQETSKIKQES